MSIFPVVSVSINNSSPLRKQKNFTFLDSLAMMDCMICVCFCNSDKTSSHIATLNIENSPFSFACYNTMPVCNCSAQYSFLLSRLSAKTLATSATILIFLILLLYKRFPLFYVNNSLFLLIISSIFSIYSPTSLTLSHRSIRPSGKTLLVMLPAPNATMVCFSSMMRMLYRPYLPGRA